MELKEFISETIKQISDGLTEGNKYIKETNKGEGVEDKYKEVSFDIAVTTSDEDTVGVGGKVTIAKIFSAGADSESTSNKTQYSRVQFSTYIHVKTT
jgi:hypothetical protein